MEVVLCPWLSLSLFVAAVSHPCRYGRRRMQNVGFIMMFVLFLICGVAFPQLRGSTTGLHVFQFLYFFSSFW
jgi:hypothetical protein